MVDGMYWGRCPDCERWTHIYDDDDICPTCQDIDLDTGIIIANRRKTDVYTKEQLAQSMRDDGIPLVVIATDLDVSVAWVMQTTES